jgi:uncharacterized protein
MRHCALSAALALCGATLAGDAFSARADQKAPELSFLSPAGHFHDVGGVVSEPVRDRLDASLAGLETRTGHRVHMLVLASLTGGLARLDATVAAGAAQWGIGRDHAHAGILFVYAQDMDLLHVNTLLGAEVPSVEKGIEELLHSIARLQGAGDQDGAFEQAVSGITALLEGREPTVAQSPRAGPPGAAPGGRATGYVVDGAGILSPGTVESLNSTLHLHEQETSNQVVVHTVTSLGGEAIETYSLRLATSLKAGQKGKDNGVLLLVSRDDHKLRIEVGYGLEGALPDVLCARIIRDEMVPRFKQGDMDGGVVAGVDKILGAIRGEYKATAADHARHALRFVPSLPALAIQPQIAFGFLFWILTPLWVALGPSLFRVRELPVRLGALVGAPVSLFLISQYPFFLASLAILGFLAFRSRMDTRKHSTWSSGRRSGSSGSSSGSSWSSSSDSSSSSSSSSYSGGGGDFGGGGSSGSW